MKRNKNTTPTPTCPILYSRIGLKHFAIVKDDRFFLRNCVMGSLSTTCVVDCWLFDPL